MNSHVQLITSKPVMMNVANSLKIPTIQGKTIIKMKSPSMLLHTRMATDSPDQKIPIASSAIGSAKSEPLSLDKTGGLFDLEDEGNYARTTRRFPVELMINHEATFRPTVSKLINLTNSKVDKSYLDMDTEHFDFADFNHNNQPACFTPSTPLAPVADLTIPLTPKKKFSEKLSDANLKVKIVKSTDMTTTSGQNLTEATPFLDLDLEDLQLNQIMTPSIEKECLQYLQAIQADENELKSARIMSPNQIMHSMGVNDAQLESMLHTGGLISSAENHNVFLSQTSPKASKPPALTLTLNPASDHVYSNNNNNSSSSSNNKRPITSLLEGDETSSASFASSDVPGTSASLTSSKRQRTRGIYRAEDITNEDDLQNYLERRKKNNISSKISRANKKNYYSQMDERSVTLENENRMLEVKVQKLEEINKLMKDYLIENFSNKIK